MADHPVRSVSAFSAAWHRAVVVNGAPARAVWQGKEYFIDPFLSGQHSPVTEGADRRCWFMLPTDGTAGIWVNKFGQPIERS